MSLCLAHSGHSISDPSVIKPLPTKEEWHIAQMKQSLCQFLSSNEINLVPPIPVMGLLHEVHLLANKSAKQLAQ